MRLVSLSANGKNFKTIRFNESGASFILARQNNPEQFDNNKTYNGVGKSLSVALIHFCLGASNSNTITQSLRQKLPGWIFTLEIKIKSDIYRITRHTNTPSEVYFNDDELTLKELNARLGELCFNIPSDLQGLSFRALIPFFIRPSKNSYINYNSPEKSGTAYYKQLYNAFLLGLDTSLSQSKMQIKKQIDETLSLQKNIKEDPILKQFFRGCDDSSLALADLEEQINKFEADLNKFEVSDNYYLIKQEADEIKRLADKIENKITLKNISIENIDNSLKITPDVKRCDIQSIYNESKLVFQLETEKLLSELDIFYHDLTTNRTRRLQEQRHSILNELRELKKQFEKLKTDLDNRMKFLDAHQSLDVFTKVNSKLSELKQKREKLQAFEKLQHQYEQRKISLRRDMALESEETSIYLDEIKTDINNTMEYFRKLAKRFYPKALSGITVTNNDGTNQIRYNIDAKIQSDSSDGINSVKLFCYDMTLLMMGSNHSIDFIFHDSRLFGGIDELHCHELFRIVEENFSDKQYIASINQNQLVALPEKTQEFVRKHIIQNLTDDSDDGKLLGITVELEYD